MALYAVALHAHMHVVKSPQIFTEKLPMQYKFLTTDQVYKCNNYASVAVRIRMYITMY